MIDPILAFLTDRESAMVKLLGQFVGHNTPAHAKEAVAKLAGDVALACRERGGTVEIVPSGGPVADQLRVSFPGNNPETKPALILAHIDTVWPVDETDRRPFSVEGDRATGPGVYDMKAGLVQALFALEALYSTGRKPNRPVVLLVTTDEETGSQHSRSVIEAEATGAEVALIVEPCTGSGALKTARKGSLMYDLSVVGKAAHAGVEPEMGVSALAELARQILYLESLNDFEIGTTVTVGVASGGTRRNVVPAEATAEIDVRVVTGAESERIDTLISGLKPLSPGVQVTVTGGQNRPPMERSEAIGHLFDLARTIGAELGFELDEALTGGGSDGNFTAALGIPTLDGLGAVGGGGHALTEHVVIPEMPRRSALLAHLLTRL